MANVISRLLIQNVQHKRTRSSCYVYSCILKNIKNIYRMTNESRARVVGFILYSKRKVWGMLFSKFKQRTDSH